MAAAAAVGAAGADSDFDNYVDVQLELVFTFTYRIYQIYLALSFFYADIHFDSYFNVHVRVKFSLFILFLNNTVNFFNVFFLT